MAAGPFSIAEDTTQLRKTVKDPKIDHLKIAELHQQTLELLNQSRHSDSSAALFQPILHAQGPSQKQEQESYLSPLRRDRVANDQLLNTSEEKRRSRGQPSQAN